MPSKTRRDFAKQAYKQEALALAAVLDTLAGLDAAGQAFVVKTAAERLGIAVPAGAAKKPRTRKPVDKTHWYSDSEPFGPRNLDC